MQSIEEPRTLAEFASQITKAAHHVETWCISNGYPAPTLHPSEACNSLPVIPESAPRDVHIARQALIDAAKRVHQIAIEPSHGLQDFAVNIQHLACLRWICHFNILSFVPGHGSISYYHLAQLTRVPVDTLRSVVRMVICGNFFHEPALGSVCHSRSSAHFANASALQDYVMYLADLRTPVAMKFADATAKWEFSTDKTETAFNIAFGTNLQFFEFLSKTTQLRERSISLMKFGASLPGAALHHLVGAIAWADLGPALIVDIGGNIGHASISLAQAYPNLRFVVQDLPGTIEHAQAQARELEASIQAQISFRAHDFFNAQPELDADVYLLRRILHDWPDQEARAILANISDVMKPSARLLIMDTVLPEPGSVSLSQESVQRSSDLNMRQTFNGHERDLAEWSKLLEGINERWKVSRVVTPFGSNLSVIEVVFESAVSAP